MTRFCWIALFLAACRPPDADPGPSPGPKDPIFAEPAAETGLAFRHDNGWSGQFYLPEIMGSGGALLDYDGDGDLDVYLRQGGPLTAPAERGALTDRLFRNDSSAGPNGPALRFTDVAAESGIHARGHGMGAIAGDVDNDGDVDLYLTNFGPNQLWLNHGDGTFREADAGAGAADPRWSVSAVFLDYDRDGWLDLFVGNYVDFTMAGHKDCYHGRLDYCSPSAYNPVPDALWRNRGDGSFEDVTARAGLAAAFGSALGAVSADFNGDAWPDIYVANDGNANQLWLNQGDGTFRDTALLSGCALNAGGFAEAGMGVDAADYDGDGDTDLFMTHLTGETNTIYVNDGGAFFEDRSVDTRLGSASKPYTGFGAAWLDFDNDGRLDLMAVNGAVTAVAGLADDYPYHQKNQLFRGLDDGSFEEIGARSGLTGSEVSRGALFGDLDNDGDTDVVVCNNRGPARLRINRVGARNRWLRVRVEEPQSGRIAIGALVEARLRDNRVLWRPVRRNAGYASSHDPRVLLGLGEDGEVVELRVHWPEGDVEAWREPGWNRNLTLRRGEGTPASP